MSSVGSSKFLSLFPVQAPAVASRSVFPAHTLRRAFLSYSDEPQYPSRLRWKCRRRDESERMTPRNVIQLLAARGCTRGAASSGFPLLNQTRISCRRRAKFIESRDALLSPISLSTSTAAPLAGLTQDNGKVAKPSQLRRVSFSRFCHLITEANEQQQSRYVIESIKPLRYRPIRHRALGTRESSESRIGSSPQRSLIEVLASEHFVIGASASSSAAAFRNRPALTCIKSL